MGTAPFAGAVLTGGASRRMGSDKALLEIDGVVQVRRVVDALHAAGAAPVACIGGDGAAIAALGLTHVDDDHPGEGPLGGLVTALERSAAGAIVVVLAVDLVRPDPCAIGGVAAAVGEDVDLAVARLEGRAQWLHAAWRRDTALPHLVAAFAAGERSIHRSVVGLRVEDVHGIRPDALVDVDRPEDLTSLRARR